MIRQNQSVKIFVRQFVRRDLTTVSLSMKGREEFLVPCFPDPYPWCRIYREMLIIDLIIDFCELFTG